MRRRNGRHGRIERVGCMLALFVLLCAGMAKASAVQSLYVTTVVQLPDDFLAIHYDALGAAKTPAKSIDASALSVTIGSEPVKIIEASADRDVKGSGIAYVLLIDISKSLSAEMEQQMFEAYINLVDSMTDKDRAAIITFGDEAKLMMDFQKDRAVLGAQLSSMSARDQSTALYDGLDLALKVATRDKSVKDDRYVIVSLTDGINESPTGFTFQETKDKLAREGIPLYSMILQPYGKATAVQTTAIQELGELSRASGGDVYPIEPEEKNKYGNKVKDAFNQFKMRVQGGHVVYVDISAIPKDNAMRTLALTIEYDAIRITGYKEVRLAPMDGPVAETPTPEPSPDATPEPSLPPGETPTPDPAATPDPDKKPLPTWVGYLIPMGISFAISFIAGLIRKMRNKKAKRTPEEEIAEMERSLLMEDPMLTGERTQAFEEQGPVVLRLLIEGPQGVERREAMLRTVLRFGRASDRVDVPLGDSSVSSEHFLLKNEGGRIILCDAGSRNGTYINGARVSADTPIVVGDRIRVGKTIIRIEHM